MRNNIPCELGALKLVFSQIFADRVRFKQIRLSVKLRLLAITSRTSLGVQSVDDDSKQHQHLAALISHEPGFGHNVGNM